MGVFPKCRAPPPLFGGPPSKKKFEGLFCVLGPKEHFWFLQKFSLFNNPVFTDFFPAINRPRPKIQLSLSDQIDPISPPPIVKHVLAPQNDFGCQKLLQNDIGVPKITRSLQIFWNIFKTSWFKQC